MVEGEIPVFSDSVSTNQVLISKALATKMKLKLGDKIYTYYIQDDIRARRLTIAGIYQTNFSEYDNLFFTDGSQSGESLERLATGTGDRCGITGERL